MIYYRNMLVILCVAIFATNVPAYISSLSSTEKQAPMLWMVGFGLLSLPWLTRQALKTDILKSPLIFWCFGYCFITLTGFFLSPQSEVSWQEVRWRFLTIAELFIFHGLLANHEAANLARQTLVATVLFGVALNIYEFFVPLSFSQFIGRSAGLYLHPNLAGEALVMGMIFGLTVLPPWVRGPFILLTGIGIFTTFSRGSILAWVLVVMGFLLFGKISLKHFLLSIAISLLLVVIVLLPRWDHLLMELERSGTLNKNVIERVEWLMDPTGVSDSSSEDRKRLAKRAWETVADNPILGSGTGSFREVDTSAHNQYLVFMQDHGLLGAAILPLLVVAVAWGVHGESRVLAILFGFTVLELSLFTHNILYEPYSLLAFALMASMAVLSHQSLIMSPRTLSAE